MDCCYDDDDACKCRVCLDMMYVREHILFLVDLADLVSKGCCVSGGRFCR